MAKGDKYSELAEGYEYPTVTFSLDQGSVSAYLEATGQSGSAGVENNQAPPMAVAARALAELSRGIISPPGTVHASQEFEFNKIVTVGESLTLISKIEKRQDRGELHTLITAFSIVNQKREVVMTSLVTVACRSVDARWMRKETLI